MGGKLTKRISCRVINSVPMGVINAGLQPLGQSNEHLYEFDELTSASFWLKQAHKKPDNFKSFHIGIGSLSAMPIGQILDCFA